MTSHRITRKANQIKPYLLHDLQGTPDFGADFGDLTDLSLFTMVLPFAGCGVATWVAPFLPPANRNIEYMLQIHSNNSIANSPNFEDTLLQTNLFSGLAVWQPLLSYQKEAFSEHFQHLSSCLPLAENITSISSNTNTLLKLTQE